MPAGYPVTGGVTQVDLLLQQPEILSRELTSLVRKRLIADRIFARGSAEQVKGGMLRFQRAESIYTDRDPEKVAPRAFFPRTGWSEELRSAAVNQWGLEVPINALAIRRHAIDQIDRAEIKLANRIVKMIDTEAMNLLTTDADVQTFAASGDWTTAATDIFADLAEALRLLDVQDEGYEGTTLIVNPAQFKDLLTDKDIRDAMPREDRESAQRTGIVQGILGFDEILRTNQLAAGTVIATAAKVVGTIADEAPSDREGYTAFDPGDNGAGDDFAPVYVKVYEEPQGSDTIVRGARWPAMGITDPKAAVKITGA